MHLLDSEVRWKVILEAVSRHHSTTSLDYIILESEEKQALLKNSMNAVDL